MAKLKPISNRSRYEQILEELEKRILNGEFPEGERLPSEAKLAEQLGVGRRAIREVLRVLEMKGLIQIINGVGAKVNRNDLDSFLTGINKNIRSYLSINKADIQHIQELRSMVSSEAVQRLAEQADPQTLKELQDNLKKQEEAAEKDDALSYQKIHITFHQMIVDSLKNPLISMIYNNVLNIIFEPIYKTAQKPGLMKQAIAEHIKIVKEIKAGHKQGALEALNIHLKRFVTRIDPSEDKDVN